MPVRLVVEDGPHKGVSAADMRRRAAAMLSAVHLPDAELSVVLTGDGPMQALNRVYRDKDQPTDVLAFAQRDSPLAHLAGNLLGDVIVSVPTARRQAKARRTTLEAELTMLLAHGVLHLLGWDHDTESRNRLMRRETLRLCAAARKAAAEGPRVKGATAQRRKPGRA